MQDITLQNSFLKAELILKGAYIKSLYHKMLDKDILYPMGKIEARGGSFCLIPYCNRIENGSFKWDGKTINLPPNPISLPHSIHGVGWSSKWSILENNRSSITLKLDHIKNSHWPFSFKASQKISLNESSIKIAIKLINSDDKTQPISLGFHPFFSALNCEQIEFKALHRWELDNMIPKKKIAICDRYDFSNKRPIKSKYDDIFEDWFPQIFRAYYDNYILKVTASSSLKRAVLFSDNTEEFFCFEPLQSAINALNMREPKDFGVTYLSPNEESEVFMEVGILYK